MRDRAWRRYIEEKAIIKRLNLQKFKYRSWYSYVDVNKNYYKKLLIIDFFAKNEHFISKSLSTTNYDSKHKVKYSPNKSKPYYRDGRKRFQTREYYKHSFTKMMKSDEFE